MKKTRSFTKELPFRMSNRMLKIILVFEIEPIISTVIVSLLIYFSRIGLGVLKQAYHNFCSRLTIDRLKIVYGRHCRHGSDTL